MVLGMLISSLSASLSPKRAYPMELSARPADHSILSSGPTDPRLSRSTPLTTNEWPFQHENANTSGLTPVMFSICSSAEAMSMLTLLEKMVGASDDVITYPSPAANAAGASLRPTSTEVVAVNIMTDRAMTTITLRRTIRTVPPPSGPGPGTTVSSWPRVSRPPGRPRPQ